MKKIKVGFFGYFKDIEAFADAGYDFIEMHTSELVSLDSRAFAEGQRKLERSPITCEVVDNPFPLDRYFTVPEFPLEDYRGTIELAAERIRQLGAKYWNFGNAYARTLMEGEGREASYQKFLQAFQMVCDASMKNGITVLLEPLAGCLTNNLTTIPAVVEFINQMKIPGVTTFVDMRWQLAENRPMAELYQYSPYIAHAHIDNPDTDYVGKKIRRTPKLTDPYDYTEYLNYVKSDSYTAGTLAVEANTFDDFNKEIRDVMDFLAEFGIVSYRNS